MEKEKNNSSRKKKSEIKKLKRSRKNKYILGVCGGAAEYFNMDATIIRILWVVSVFFGGAGLIAYLVAAILMPKSEEDEATEEIVIESSNMELILGGILIILGLFSLSNLFHFIDFNFRGHDFFRFLYFPWHLIQPLLLIFLGLYIALGNIKKTRTFEKLKRKKLFRSKKDRIVLGVCSGLGKYLNLDPTFIRIVWVLVSIISGVILGIIVYLLFVLIVPERKN